MDIGLLGLLVQAAIDTEPPIELEDWCRPYYEPYYHLLHLLAAESDVEGVCVELGVEKGRGSYGPALAGREVHGFDHTEREVEMRLMRDRFPNFHFHAEPSLPVPAWWKDKVAVLHVDTEHSYAMAREEFNAWRPWLAPGAVVCFDDTHAMGSDVGRFVVTLPHPTIFDDRLHSCGYAAVIVP